MKRTRILLVGLPRLLEEIVTNALESEDDLDLAGVARTPAAAARKAERSRADVVMLGWDDPALARSLLERLPRLAVLAVKENGKGWWLYSLRPERIRIGDLSPRGLAAAVRDAGRPRAAWWTR